MKRPKPKPYNPAPSPNPCPPPQDIPSIQRHRARAGPGGFWADGNANGEAKAHLLLQQPPPHRHLNSSPSPTAIAAATASTFSGTTATTPSSRTTAGTTTSTAASNTFSNTIATTPSSRTTEATATTAGRRCPDATDYNDNDYEEQDENGSRPRPRFPSAARSCPTPTNHFVRRHSQCMQDQQRRRGILPGPLSMHKEGKAFEERRAITLKAGMRRSWSQLSTQQPPLRYHRNLSNNNNVNSENDRRSDKAQRGGGSVFSFAAFPHDDGDQNDEGGEVEGRADANAPGAAGSGAKPHQNHQQGRSPARRVKRLRITIPEPEFGVITKAKLPDSAFANPSSSDGTSSSSFKSQRHDGDCYGGQNYGVSFRRGRRRNMEDFHSAVPDMIKGGGGKAVGFFGVFDGHGGKRCADFSARNLPKLVSHNIDKTPRSLFQNAFEKLDDQFLSIARSKSWNDGSTAVAALLRDCTLTVANAGDSKAVLSSKGQAVVMSRDHTPGHEEEKHRIEKKGGKVVFLRTWRVEATLAVSRAIGNRSLKAFVTSEPDVTTKPLQKGDDFLVLGTDGLWDHVKPQEAISIASEFLEKQPVDLKQAAKALTDLAFDRGSLDNITALVIDLRPYQPP